MDEDIDFFNLMNAINNLNNQINLLNRDYLEIRRNNVRRKYRLRKRIDPMTEYDDAEFRSRFRFTKHEVREIYGLINGAQTLEPLVTLKSIEMYVFNVIFFQYYFE